MGLEYIRLLNVSRNKSSIQQNGVTGHFFLILAYSIDLSKSHSISIKTPANGMIESHNTDGKSIENNNSFIRIRRVSITCLSVINIISITYVNGD